MNISIKKKNTGEVIFSGDFESIKQCVEAAARQKVSLRSADLRSADLSSADLSYADLRSADLRSAVLSSADLSYADLSSAVLSSAVLSYADLSYAVLSSAVLSSAVLSSADLRYADLRSAVLSSAVLSSAVLSSAVLRYADLSSAVLSSAVLSYADLSYADLSSAVLSSAVLDDIRADFLAEVLKLPNELEFLRNALVTGKVNGSTYNDGECGCLAGTMARAKGLTQYSGGSITNGLTFKADSGSPRERFFLAIKKGDTPETNAVSQIALDWTNEAIAIRDNIRATAPKVAKTTTKAVAKKTPGKKKR
jgi:uncharacterized protein YjbI with pentapeptide repeats